MSLRLSPIEQWVAEATKTHREFRESVHTILVAVANDPKLKADMIIKGGILLAIRYHSHRYTKDIDFSTSKVLDDINPDRIERALNESLVNAVAQLKYDMDCRVQKCNVRPSSVENATFPELEITIGYAYKGTRKHKRLIVGKCPTVIKIDFSINEPTPNIEQFEIGKEESLIAYCLTDLIAEKLRAFLQMGIRNRIRRQDIFDLYLLLDKHPDIDNHEKAKILDSLLIKAESRNVPVNKMSFCNEELKKRAAKEYPELEHEVEGKLPDFDYIFTIVKRFYESLPWK